MAVKTQNVQVTSDRYTKISIGEEGSFVNRDLVTVVVIESNTQPDVSQVGDPLKFAKRYNYSLEGENAIWGKAVVGSASIGVTPAKVPKTMRAVSNGLRMPIKHSNSSRDSHAISRIRRTALVDMVGLVKVVMPLFHMDRPNSLLREVDFPDPCRIKVGLEPLYKEGGTGITSSPILFSEEYIYDPASQVGFAVLEIDLGTNVIPKGQNYGIWTAYDNLKTEAPWFLPYSNKANSETDDTLFETAITRWPDDGTSSSGSWITDSGMDVPDSISKQTTVRDCYGPVALLCESSVDAWVLFGSSTLEGAYDNNQGDARGDENGNRGWGDRLFSGHYGLPFVNLAKGSDKLGYLTATDTEVTPNRSNFTHRKAIAALCAPTHVACTTGSNDITSSLTEQAFKDMFQQHLNEVKEVVLTATNFYSATYTPKITWASPYMELADQTVKPVGSTGNDPLRQEINRWMRSGTGDLEVDGFIDASFACESQDGIGKWQVDGVTAKLMTDDGTHPNAFGASKIANDARVITYYK